MDINSCFGTVALRRTRSYFIRSKFSLNEISCENYEIDLSFGFLPGNKGISYLQLYHATSTSRQYVALNKTKMMILTGHVTAEERRPRPLDPPLAMGDVVNE